MDLTFNKKTPLRGLRSKLNLYDDYIDEIIKPFLTNYISKEKPILYVTSKKERIENGN